MPRAVLPVSRGTVTVILEEECEWYSDSDWYGHL